MHIVLDYNCGPDEAVKRLRNLAAEHDVELSTGASDREGSLAKRTPVGEASATYRVADTSIEIEIVKKPPFVPESLVRRQITEFVESALND